MASREELLTDLNNTFQQIEDEEVLQQFLKSAKKVANDGSNDFEALKELKSERKELRNEKDKIYNIISYHLGSPLKTLQALSNMLLKDAERLDKKGILEFNNHLNAQIGKLQDLMGNLIEWSSLEVRNYQLNKQSVDLTEVVAAVLKKYERPIEQKQITVTKSIPEGISAKADKNMMLSIFDNLISNSLKFSQKGGELGISISLEGTQAKVSISDKGIGMSQAKLNNIFNPSRKATQKGTANELGLGMGLIVSKAYLELHDSALEIESEQGAGTKANFKLDLEVN